MKNTKLLIRTSKHLTIILAGIFILSSSSHAARFGGGGSFGGGGGSETDKFIFGAGVTTAHQTDMNSWMSGTNQVGTQDLGSAWEFSVSYFHRVAGTIYEVGLRPSYFMQNASGGGVSTNLNGYLLYPILRIYPLENSFIHFFMEVGMGYGQMSGTAGDSNTSASANFSASAFGAEGGIGVDFCFTDTHCVTVEGMVRYHPLTRSIISSTTGTFSNNLSGTLNHELEYNGLDVQNTFSGVIGQMAYTYRF